MYATTPRPFPKLFSVITVILLINMPIPFKFNSCSKKCSEHFTPSASHSTILIVLYFVLFFFVSFKKENKLKEKYIYLKSKVSKQEEKYENLTWPGFEPGHSGVALQCTNH